MRRRTRAIVAMFAAGWAAVACLVTLAPTAQAASSHAVLMSNYAFAPSAITVHLGDSISWTNRDQAPHNIVTTNAPVAINSPTLSDGQSWSYTFTTPGTYHYICGVHPDMQATVIVLAAAPASTPKPPPMSPAPHTAAATHAASAASMPAMPGMTTLPSKPSSDPSSTSHPAATTAPGVAAAGTAPPSVTPVAAVTSANGVTSARLKPLLLVAGVIAAVTVFCLLALASRPQTPTD